MPAKPPENNDGEQGKRSELNVFASSRLQELVNRLTWKNVNHKILGRAGRLLQFITWSKNPEVSDNPRNRQLVVSQPSDISGSPALPELSTPANRNPA